MSTWEPIDDRPRQPELEEAPLTKRQLKRRRNKDSKLNKKFKRLEADIDNLKSQMEALKNKITKASESTNAGFNIHQLNLTRGSSYLPLPDWLASKKAIINPKNADQECFKWAVIAASRWEEINNNPERISKLKRFEKDFDWSGIGFPVSFKDISKFEFRNQISINLLAIEGKQIYICRKGGNYKRVINLMIISESNRKHYVALKSLSRLLSIKNTNH